MAVAVLTKQPYEKFPITFDYSENMGAAETIASAQVIVIDNQDQVVSTTLTDQGTLTLGTQTVSIAVQAGSESASPYNISGRCVTSAGNQFEVDVKLVVAEIELNE